MAESGGRARQVSAVSAGEAACDGQSDGAAVGRSGNAWHPVESFEHAHGVLEAEPDAVVGYLYPDAFRGSVAGEVDVAIHGI